MFSKRSKYYSLLFSIFFFHLFSVIICGFNDVARERIKHPNNFFANLKSVSYWAWFFTWWSAWTSLITFFWVVYRWWKKDNNSYWTQFFDLNVVIFNLSSGIIFMAGWILNMITGGKKNLLTNIPHKGGLESLSKTPIGLWRLNAKQGWIIYNITWHIIAPLLVFYFFWKFSSANLLNEKKRTTLSASLFSPTIYLFYVFLRPIVDYQNIYRFKTEVYHYPHDYPFSFFNRCVGKPSWKGDTYQDTWLKQFFWIILIFGVAYLIFSLSAYYLIKWKNFQQERNIGGSSNNNVIRGLLVKKN